MKKGVSLAAVVLAVVATLSIGWNIYQAGSLRQLRAKLEVAEAASATARPEPSAPSFIGGADGSGTQRPPGADAEEAAAANAVAAGNRADQENDPIAGMSSQALRDMMANPSMQEMIHAQQESLMKIAFDDLFAWLDLPEDEAKELVDLLVEYELTGMDSALKAMDPALSQEDRASLLEGIKAEKDTVKEQIHAYLGDGERVEYFEAYKESLPERTQVSDLRKLLAETGSPLSQEQEQELLNTIYDARTKYPFDHDFTDKETMDPTQVTPSNLERYAQQYQQMQEQVRNQAGQILSADQLETFAKAQEQQRAMQQMGLQWVSRLFGSSSEQSQ